VITQQQSWVGGKGTLMGNSCILRHRVNVGFERPIFVASPSLKNAAVRFFSHQPSSTPTARMKDCADDKGLYFASLIPVFKCLYAFYMPFCQLAVSSTSKNWLSLSNQGLN
jgi:hypothetical protein